MKIKNVVSSILNPFEDLLYILEIGSQIKQQSGFYWLTNEIDNGIIEILISSLVIHRMHIDN